MEKSLDIIADRLLSMTESRSLEGPEPITAERLIEISSYTNDSGIHVTENRALAISAVWRAVHILSQGVAMLPMRVMERVERGFVEAENHPVHKLVRYQPHETMGSFVFFETAVQHVVLWGNAYGTINWADRINRRPRSIDLVPPWEVEPHRRDGDNYYRVRGVWMDAQDVLHVPGLGYDGLQGYSVLSMAAQSLGISLAAERYGAKFFGSGARLAGVLEIDGSMAAEERNNLGRQFDTTYGAANANRTAVLSSGAKYKPVGIPPGDAQMLETRKFGIADVARWFGVPLHMLGDLDKATLNNIESLNTQFLTFSLVPWIEKFEQEFDRKLLGWGSKFYCDFDESKLRRADLAARQGLYQSGRQWGYLSANDVRMMEGLNPIENGDVYLQPANMSAVGETEAQPPPPQDARSIDPATLRPVAMQQLTRLLEKERNIRQRYEGEKLTEHLARHREHVRDEMRALMDVAGVDVRRADVVADRLLTREPTDASADWSVFLEVCHEL